MDETGSQSVGLHGCHVMSVLFRNISFFIFIVLVTSFSITLHTAWDLELSLYNFTIKDDTIINYQYKRDDDQ